MARFEQHPDFLRGVPVFSFQRERMSWAVSVRMQLLFERLSRVLGKETSLQAEGPGSAAIASVKRSRQQICSNDARYRRVKRYSLHRAGSALARLPSLQDLRAAESFGNDDLIHLHQQRPTPVPRARDNFCSRERHESHSMSRSHSCRSSQPSLEPRAPQMPFVSCPEMLIDSES